ncbi:hypothetical protein ACFV4N_25115, partial [Actinosynnema sp. NPDC059797]
MNEHVSSVTSVPALLVGRCRGGRKQAEFAVVDKFRPLVDFLRSALEELQTGCVEVNTSET